MELRCGCSLLRPRLVEPWVRQARQGKEVQVFDVTRETPPSSGPALAYCRPRPYHRHGAPEISILSHAQKLLRGTRPLVGRQKPSALELLVRGSEEESLRRPRTSQVPKGLA